MQLPLLKKIRINKDVSRVIHDDIGASVSEIFVSWFGFTAYKTFSVN